MIVYEILSGETLFKGLNRYQVIMHVLNGYRPKFKFPIQYCYRHLIEKCWDQDPINRPSFSIIVETLEKDPDFIKNVDKDEYLNYVSDIKDFIEVQIKKSKNIPIEKNDEKETQEFNKSTNINKGLKINEEENNIIKDQKINEEEDNSIKSLFLNLKEFEQISLISKNANFKIYKIKNIKTEAIYSSKISMNQIEKLTKDEAIKLSKDVNLISQLNHPSFLKFIGYSPFDFKNRSRPVLVTEISSNGTMKEIIEMERNHVLVPGWDDTKKLINIYGIASGMKYLHSHNIIHRDLSPENIFFDEYLFPKIGDFGLSKRYRIIDSMTFQSTSGLKGTPAFSSPEILESEDYSKSSDVYAFSFIVYELLTCEVPFKNMSMNQIFTEVVLMGNRPKINTQIPDSYRNLIEKCWSQDQNERPSFEEIVSCLKNNSEFITENVNKEDYMKYICYIDESQKSFEANRKIIESDEPNH